MGDHLYAYPERRSNEGWRPVRSSNASPWRVLDFQNYAFFGALAGVRQQPVGEPLARDRGIPEDASAEIASMSADGDAFGRSWIALPDLLEGWGEIGLGAGYDDFIEPLRALPNPTEVRIVFWFA